MSSHNCESSYIFEVQYFVKKNDCTENIDMVYIQNVFVYVFKDSYFVKNADDSDYIDIFYLQNESVGVFGDHYFMRKLQNNDYIHKILHQYVSQYAF